MTGNHGRDSVRPMQRVLEHGTPQAVRPGFALMYPTCFRCTVTVRGHGPKMHLGTAALNRFLPALVTIV